MRLARLDIAQNLDDLDLPGYRLHPLKGDQKGRWAISVTGKWRMTFRFEDNDVHELDLENYH